MAADSTAKPDRLPWPHPAAALVAFAALYITGQGFFGLIVLAILLLASYLTKLRLPSNLIVGWVIRVAVWSLIILVSPQRHFHNVSILFEPDYVNLFGYLCAAELVQRVWTRTPGGRGVSRGEAMMLTALVLAAASNTYSRFHIQVLGALYALCMVACLRSFPRRDPSLSSSRRKALVGLRVAAALVAVITGLGVVFVVSRYEYWITAWAMKFTRNNPRTAEIGLSPSPSLGARFNKTESLERVMLIGGPVSERHLRAMAFDTYEMRHWLPRLEDRDFKNFEATSKQSDPPSAKQLRFTRLGNTYDLLVLPPNCAEATSESQLERDSLGSVRQKNSDESLYAANVLTNDEKLAGPLDVPLDPARRRRALTIPAGTDPQVIQLARQVVGFTSDPATKVMRLAQHLRTEHAYSLEYDPGSADPLNDFILNRRAAHCQYFASAMVVMARAVGVPARYVTGYYAHESSGPGRMVVRGRDAHAWAECFIDGGAGWITVDATPAGGRPDARFGDSTSKWRRFLEWIQDLPGRIRSWLVMPARQTILLLLALPTAIIFIVWLVRTLLARRRKLRMNDDRYAPAREELVAASRRFERWLQRQGNPCAANRTWREHVAALPDPQLCLRFVEAYDEVRFGGNNGTTLCRVNELLNELESPSTIKPQQGHHHG